MEETKTVLISPQQAIKILGVGWSKMYEDLLKREDFPSFKMGNRWFVNRELLQEWANKMCAMK